MNKYDASQPKKTAATAKTAKPALSTKRSEPRKLTEIKHQESPIERALKLSSEQIIAAAIRDMIKKDELN